MRQPADDHGRADNENHADDADPTPRTVDLDHLLLRRVSVGRRALRMGMVVVLLLVVAGLILRSISSLPSQTSRAPSLTTAASIVLVSNLSYGAVTVNAQPLTAPLPQVIALRQGDNAITLSAAPFLPHTCHVRWPEGVVSSTCGSGSGGVFPIADHFVVANLVIYLRITAADLAPDLRIGALSAIAQALDAVQPQTSVPAGQYYPIGRDSTGNILSQPAPAPLNAVVHFALPASGTRQPAYCDSQLLCAGALNPAATEAHPAVRAWAVFTPVTVSWQFTSAAGIPTTLPPLLSQFQVELVLAYTSASGWQVLRHAEQFIGGQPLTQQLTASICGVGALTLANLADERQRNSAATINWVQDNGLAGCQLELLQPNSGTRAGLFIWRFGVLLAADAATHATFPDVPLAPPAEVIAATTASQLPPP
ncbi:MAG: hypothetical protein OJF49_003669 [Ktedonobacterales bacterium]|jgi:hypothetical protein|nr:MAG: hypothetical protein OJF49_003669 [Ktedonobacterales bacterium]